MLNNAPPQAPAPKTTVQRIQELIANGEFPRGSRLPPQRDLSGRLNVSRPSLREALSVLEALGVLNTKPGSGTFVSDADGGERAPLRFENGHSLEDVYQFRFVAEGYAARLAAIRITETQLAELREVLSEHQEAVRRLDLMAGSQHDYEFHRLIMLHSGNGVFLDLHANYRTTFLKSQFLPTQRPDRLWEPIIEHENVLRTFAHRDPEGASYFMHVHIARAADRVGVALKDAL